MTFVPKRGYCGECGRSWDNDEVEAAIRAGVDEANAKWQAVFGRVVAWLEENGEVAIVLGIRDMLKAPAAATEAKP